MQFTMVPDVPISDVLAQRIEGLGLKLAIVHGSGRPWIFASDDYAWTQRRMPSGTVVAAPATAGRILENARSIGDLLVGMDGLARDVSTTSFFLASTATGVRAQGSLSTQRQIFWSVVDGIAVASNSISVLHQLSNPKIDRTSLALTMLKSRPIQIFADRTPWQSIKAAGIGEWLHFDGSTYPRAVRWWREPRERLDACTGPTAVRRALQQVIDESTEGCEVISADLSGGLDSTSLCLLLQGLPKELRTFRTSSINDANDESRRARRVAKMFGMKLHEFPPLAETSSAFTIEADEDLASILLGPLVWAGSRGYLRSLAPEVLAQGSTTHFTGLGGDELFDVVPGIFRRLRREGIHVAMGAAWRLHAQRRNEPTAMLSAIFDRESYQSYLARATECLRGASAWDRTAVYSWFPPTTFPAWMSAHGKELIIEAFSEAIHREPEPLGDDPLGQQVVESIAFQGQVLRQFGEIFPQINWQAPFTDYRVVEAALQSPASMRTDERRDKAVLAEAVSDVAPPGFFDKRGRGDFTTDVYDEHRRQRVQLMREFRDSRLLETGLVDPDLVRSALYEPSSSDIGLFDVESIVVAERWLRGVESLSLI